MMTFMCLAALTAAGEDGPTLARADIHIRDPFILAVPETKTYYMYGTIFPLPDGPGFPVYTSGDLDTWTKPKAAFRRPADFWADRDFWAPEVHRYQDRYYMFASFKAEGACRGTQILKAYSPEGPFEPHSDGPVTPRTWECLDGTLYVDPNGRPWMVFCHEWVQVTDGEMCAMPLTPDLERADGEPILLFHASEVPWIVDFTNKPKSYVTDGPFLHRAENGHLVLFWSSFSKQGYGQAVARSESGELAGPWKHDPELLYSDDGGHGMLFRDFKGRLRLSIHKPNKNQRERPLFLYVEEKDGAFHVSETLSEDAYRSGKAPAE
jgi:beta-xylosidase